MLLTEYNEAATMELFKAEGKKEGILETLIRMVKKKRLSVEEAADEADMTLDEFTDEMAKS